MLLAEYTAGELVLIIGAIGTQLVSVGGVVYAIVKLITIGKTVDATHTLANSQMGRALQIGADATHQSAILTAAVAERTGSSADMVQAGMAASKAATAAIVLSEHEQRQAKVDRGETTPNAPPEPPKLS